MRSLWLRRGARLEATASDSFGDERRMAPGRKWARMEEAENPQGEESTGDGAQEKAREGLIRKGEERGL